MGLLKLKLLLFLLFSFAIRLSFSSSASHRHTNNASDQHALLQFKASVFYDPQNVLLHWNPNRTAFCNWSGVACSPRRDRVVLLDLKDMALQGSLSPFLANLSFLRQLLLRQLLLHWNPNRTAFCNWTGVACSPRRDRVVLLYLRNIGLQGSLSPFLANLSFLRELNLFNNSFYGRIPEELGYLRRLRKLSFSNNPLSGRIPCELGLLTNLEFLSLEVNSMSGTIPSSLANISSLTVLALGVNNLSGVIPPEFGTLAHLKLLYIEDSKVSGTIPSSLTNISTLNQLALDSNHISGIIPPEIGRLTNLTFLDLGANYLEGSIPSSLSNCTSLEFLQLSENDLIGRIPWELGHNLPNLQGVYLHQNRLSGNIPNSFANCFQLTLLELSLNQLSGTVPTELGKLALLRGLYLGGNQLVSGSTAELPFLTHLTNCSLLEHLNLGNNRLTGVLPPAIGQLSTKLSWLILEANFIGGRIPQQIGNLTNLTLLALDSNLFSGSIPSEFKILQKLERLDLSDNKLEGSIPSEMGQLQSLGLLALDENMLSGPIPRSLGDLQQLRRLTLSENQLSGNIPAALGNCWRLELIDLSYNRLQGNIPPQVAGLQNVLFYFNLSSNSLQGFLPPEIGKMVMTQAIDVSANRLTGSIPATLGSCAALAYLNLSHNALQGPIPLSLGDIKGLQDMDLSSNKLWGTIPKSLEKLHMLTYLNFSHNNLTGEVPRGGNFANFSNTSFMGNPRLCGSWIHLPACPLSKQAGHSSLKRVILPIASVGVFILWCLLMRFFWSRKILHLPKTFALKRELPVISYQQLIHATDGFSEANLLGVGSFGSVYKGILGDGTMIAVKVFNLQDEGSNRSFKKECKVLRRIRHRNLVRIVTSCSSLNFRALVLQFMPNGSLEKNLYPDDRSESEDGNACPLSLLNRLNISIDIAHGMQYLHHDSHVQVLHCDLKPSNVLLDDNMTAHITDFGLARITCPASEDSFTSTHALRGSIGYIAPEYGLEGRASTKGDVYSYGILLLEMLTRRRPTSEMFTGGLDLRKWVSMAFPDRLLDVVDGSLLTDVSEEGIDGHNVYKCLTELVLVGLLCTTQSPEERPNMRDVAGLLEGIRATFLGITNTGAFKFPADISSLLDSRTVIQKNDGGASGSQTSSTQ